MRTTAQSSAFTLWSIRATFVGSREGGISAGSSKPTPLTASGRGYQMLLRHPGRYTRRRSKHEIKAQRTRKGNAIKHAKPRDGCPTVVDVRAALSRVATEIQGDREACGKPQAQPKNLCTDPKLRVKCFSFDRNPLITLLHHRSLELRTARAVPMSSPSPESSASRQSIGPSSGHSGESRKRA